MCSAVSSGQIASDLEGDDFTGQVLTEVKCLDRSPSLELIQTVADAVHRAPERLTKPPGIAVVVAVGEQHVLGFPVLLEPLQPLSRDQRVDQHTLVEQAVRADIHPDVLMTRRPVPQTGGNLPHTTILPSHSGRAPIERHTSAATWWR